MRRQLLHARAEQSAADHERTDRRLMEQLRQWLDGFPTGSTVAAYVPAAEEPGGALDFVDTLLAMPTVGQILLPICPPGPPTALHWGYYQGVLRPGRYGLLEPPNSLGPTGFCHADIALLPAVAADRRGFRLGRGAGYYDRSVEHTTAHRAALVFPHELVDEVPHDEHDQPVHTVISATEIVGTDTATRGV
nr:5-formyltetrahydrofolate cyclo-ligase [Corynebacterium sp. TAE3-ERU12]